MEVDVKYRIRKSGTYWAGINTCPKCGHIPDEPVTQIALGIASSSIGDVMIVECPKCFKHWYFHCEESFYEYFKRYIEEFKVNPHYL